MDGHSNNVHFNDVTNPNSKTEIIVIIYPDKLSHVNTNNASSGLLENVILTNLVPYFWQENKAPKYVKSWGRHPYGT